MKICISNSVLVAALSFCSSANATTGLEFLKLSASEQVAVLKPITLEYVSLSYKNVPDELDHSLAIERAVKKNGWGARDIKDISIDVAKSKGMSK